MKKILCIGLIVFVTLTSFAVHKFYIAIYQIYYVPEKKMLQITSRIFIDDLNTALERKFAVKTHIGEPNETAADVAYMNNYLLEKINIKINGNVKSLHYISKERENNIVIGYYSIKNISKIKSIEVQNAALMDVFPEQQNIIQTNFNNKKESLLLTSDSRSGTVK